MNKQQYMDLVDRELNAIKDVIQRKNADYTGGADDPFANFRVTEALGLADARTGVLVRMVDKIQRVKSFIAKGKLEVKDESVQDAARDIIGYSLILLGLLEPVTDGGLRLKLGKRYRRRDGRITGPISKNDGDWVSPIEYPFLDSENVKSYRADGSYSASVSRLDLVQELAD
jgi:hypothetical protein